ncbi:hypothetical protein P3X46_033584 [Hevea brasiliensis]|uniref:non-specific serine/threonine protein kinase n=1 Tax=Hevea brasiliensis TaxID=3981 RepID=A0ABQ9KCY2_HEVBR|nr:hypothetical protein P3X46_033584 [Hevea brasiliensis]
MHVPLKNQEFELKKYSFEQLALATCKFLNNFLLSHGFGQVYREKLEGKVIAIKKLKLYRIKLDDNEFEVLSSVCHPNIVKLDGYCNQGAYYRLHVLEYVSNKSLRSHLYGKSFLSL